MDATSPRAGNYTGVRHSRFPEMPLYFFTLDDEVRQAAGEELPSDAAARQHADIVAREIARNQFGREQQRLTVFNERAQPIYSTWTKRE